MSEESFALEVVTPAGKILEDVASQVTLPSSDGEIGILPKHTKYSGLLGTGLLEYFSAKKKQAVRLVVSGGFCNFSGNTLKLLADSVVTADKVDKDNYAAKRDEYSQALNTKDTTDPDWEYAKQELRKIEAVDKLISH